MSPDPTPWHKLKTNPLLQSVATPPTASAGEPGPGECTNLNPDATEWWIMYYDGWHITDVDPKSDGFLHVVLARPQGEGPLDELAQQAQEMGLYPTPCPQPISGEAMEWLRLLIEYRDDGTAVQSVGYAREILRFIETQKHP